MSEPDRWGFSSENGIHILEEGGPNLRDALRYGEPSLLDRYLARLTTQLIRLVELRLRSKSAPRQVDTLLVTPKGPKLKSSEDTFQDCNVTDQPCGTG